MSKRSRMNHGKATTPVQPAKRRPMAVTMIVLAAVVAVCLGLWWANKARATASGLPASTRQAAAMAEKPDFGKLTGKWQRTDGGYILEVRGMAPDGKLDAAYFNPNPINVSKAAASYEVGLMKVYVELQDKGYPGNYYILRYDAGSDQLAGIYYHLGIGQQFDVIFVRMK
jgi:hypothetical protein